MASKVMEREWRFSGSLNKIYPYEAQKWQINWILNKTGDNIDNRQSVARRAVFYQVCCYVEH